VNTCQGVLSPCGGGGGSSFFFFEEPSSPSLASSEDSLLDSSCFEPAWSSFCDDSCCEALALAWAAASSATLAASAISSGVGFGGSGASDAAEPPRGLPTFASSDGVVCNRRFVGGIIACSLRGK